MRKLLIQLHKYTGLVLGLLLAVTGLSGSLLVFDRELDEWLTPETVAFEAPAEIASLDLAFANATAAVDNGTAPTRIALGRHTGAPHIIRFPTPEGARGPIEVSINPVDSSVLAVRGWGDYPVTWVYYLHMAFLGGETGELIVGIIGLCMLFLCVTGTIIWWPRMGRWARAFALNWRLGVYRLNFDIHKVIGIYFMPVFIVVAFSGVELIFHDEVESVVDFFLPVSEASTPQSPADAVSSERISADRAATIAGAVFPGARLLRLYMPASPTEPYQLTYVRPGDNWNEYGASGVFVDQYSGNVLDVWDHREQPAGTTFLEWLFPLHNGDALGIIGRLIVFISGLLPAILFGTGFYLWWKPRQKV